MFDSRLWVSICEANLQELIEIRKSLLVAPSSEDSDRQLFYTEILVLYFRQDVTSLQAALSAQAAWLQNHPDLEALAVMRLEVRSHSVDIEKISNRFDILYSGTPHHLLKAEASFVMAYASTLVKDFRRAEVCYLAASEEYSLAGSPKKSLRAQLSSLASYSCINPESRLFPEYTALYRKAMMIVETQTAAACLLNISREFQRLDALTIALDYVCQALTLHDYHCQGSREQGLCLVHRAQIYFHLDRPLEGQRDLFFAASIGNEEVQSSCKILADQYQLNLKTLTSDKILPTWEERMQDAVTHRPLGKLESQLLVLIAQEPRDRFALMTILYGEKIDSASRDGRFKNLLSRLRSRFPGLIILENDHYKIADPFSLKAILVEQGKIG